MKRTPKTGDIVGVNGTIYRVEQWRDTESGELRPLQGKNIKIYYEKESIPRMLLLWPLS